MSTTEGRRLYAGRATCATFALSKVCPNCDDPHVGPHNRCGHPTAPAPGYRRCAGDNACPIRLHETHPSRFCPDHADQVWALPEQDRNAELAAINALMTGQPSPHRTRPVAIRKPT